MIKGLFDELYQIPVQMYLFQIISIVRHYLTNKPDFDATKDLLLLTRKLAMSSKAEFMSELSRWYIQSEAFLKKRAWMLMAKIILCDHVYTRHTVIHTLFTLE